MTALRTYRQKKGLTLAEMAAVLSVTAATVQRWESGLRTPSLGAALRVQALTNGQVKPSDFAPRTQVAS